MLNDLQGAGPQVGASLSQISLYTRQPINRMRPNDATDKGIYCSHTFCFHHSVHYNQHALMMNPVSAKKMVMLLQEAYPARPKVDG